MLTGSTEIDGENVAMYAVIQSGGKQHRVAEGQTVRLEKIEGGMGEEIAFDKVLMIGEGSDLNLGSPYIDKAVVTGEIVSQGRGKKIKIVKFRRRKHHRKQMGHRQWFTEVKITDISASGAAKPKAKAKAEEPAPKAEAKPAAEKATAKKATAKKATAKKATAKKATAKKATAKKASKK